MAADDTRRTRAKHAQAGLEKAELWVRPEAKRLLKALEQALRSDPAQDAQAARVLARLQLSVDLISPPQGGAPAVPFDRAAVTGAIIGEVKDALAARGKGA